MDISAGYMLNRVKAFSMHGFESMFVELQVLCKGYPGHIGSADPGQLYPLQ